MNYRFANRAGKSADLYLYDDIGASFFGEGITAKQVVDDVQKLGDAKTLNVRINSAGGNVFEGLAIYNALTRAPVEVLTHVDGIAASIASIIAMAGSKISMAENAMMMIHDPYTGGFGTAEELRKTADTLDTIRGNLVATYAKRTGQNENDISDMMAAETWFTASDALQAGFTDSIGQALQIAASASPMFSKFQNVPAAIAARAHSRPRMEMRAARLTEITQRFAGLLPAVSINGLRP